MDRREEPERSDQNGVIMKKVPEARYEQLYGQLLPDPPSPRGDYVPAVEHGGVVFVSGQTPIVRGGSHYQGRLGDSLSVDEGKAAARMAISNALGALKAQVGELSRITRILQLIGYVRSTDDFTKQSEVIDGASEVLTAVFGEAGRHSRAALGTNSLPRGVAVELILVAAL